MFINHPHFGEETGNCEAYTLTGSHSYETFSDPTWAAADCRALPLRRPSTVTGIFTKACEGRHRDTGSSGECSHDSSRAGAVRHFGSALLRRALSRPLPGPRRAVAGSLVAHESEAERRGTSAVTPRDRSPAIPARAGRQCGRRGAHRRHHHPVRPVTRDPRSPVRLPRLNPRLRPSCPCRRPKQACRFGRDGGRRTCNARHEQSKPNLVGEPSGTAPSHRRPGPDHAAGYGGDPSAKLDARGTREFMDHAHDR